MSIKIGELAKRAGLTVRTLDGEKLFGYTLLVIAGNEVIKVQCCPYLSFELRPFSSLYEVGRSGSALHLKGCRSVPSLHYTSC